MPTGKEADHTCNIAAIAHMKRLLRENSLYKIQHHVWAKLLYTISSKHQVSVRLDVLFYTFLLLGIHVSTTLITLLPATAAALRPQPTRRTSSKLVANLLQAWSFSTFHLCSKLPNLHVVIDLSGCQLVGNPKKVAN